MATPLINGRWRPARARLAAVKQLFISGRSRRRLTEQATSPSAEFACRPEAARIVLRPILIVLAAQRVEDEPNREWYQKSGCRHPADTVDPRSAGAPFDKEPGAAC
jgi:hypothetical protein